MKYAKPLFLTALFASLLPALQGCFPVVATGVAVGVLAVTDRRTFGTQTEDESIEWKVSNRVTEKFGDKVHLNVTSYNRKVLLTGEVPDEQARAAIGEIATKTEKVDGAYNELHIAAVSSLDNRARDTYITSKVKTRFVDSGKFAPNHVKVVTEAEVVYLLGIVNQREADAAIQVARTTSGVRKVINVLEVVPEAETRRIDAMGSENRKPTVEPPRDRGTAG